MLNLVKYYLVILELMQRGACIDGYRLYAPVCLLVICAHIQVHVSTDDFPFTTLKALAALDGGSRYVPGPGVWGISISNWNSCFLFHNHYHLGSRYSLCTCLFRRPGTVCSHLFSRFTVWENAMNYFSTYNIYQLNTMIDMFHQVGRSAG